MSELAVPHWLRGLERRFEEITQLLAAAETPEWAKQLERKIDHVLNLQGVIISDQDHLNSVVTALSADFAAIIADLQAQPGAAALDFTAADALVASSDATVASLTPAPAPEQAAADQPLATNPAPVDTSVASV